MYLAFHKQRLRKDSPRLKQEQKQNKAKIN